MAGIAWAVGQPGPGGAGTRRWWTVRTVEAHRAPTAFLPSESMAAALLPCDKRHPAPTGWPLMGIPLSPGQLSNAPADARLTHLQTEGAPKTGA